MWARGEGRGGLFLGRFYFSKWLTLPVLGHKKVLVVLYIYLVKFHPAVHSTDARISTLVEGPLPIHRDLLDKVHCVRVNHGNVLFIVVVDDDLGQHAALLPDDLGEGPGVYTLDAGHILLSQPVSESAAFTATFRKCSKKYILKC